MRQFEVVIENRIGALADVCEVLARAKVNIKAISTELRDGIGIIKVITDDEDVTRKALGNAQLDFSEYEIIPVRLMDRPGELARLARSLANLGIDIESVFMTNRDAGTAEIAFKVSNLNEARKLLK
ncbi:MAG: ACT domain-containing protein [Candidatus Aenigmatarchaeota archaeon]|nr:hypothetical protein [Candidatus Aenigmarchaeota archaeon]